MLKLWRWRFEKNATFGYVEDINNENEQEEQPFDAKALVGMMTEALTDKDGELQMYLAYRRGDYEAQQAGSDCYKAQPEEKKKRKTRLTGDDRRTGKNLRRPRQLVAVAGVGYREEAVLLAGSTWVAIEQYEKALTIAKRFGDCASYCGGPMRGKALRTTATALPSAHCGLG
jgi:hypothetical protein